MTRRTEADRLIALTRKVIDTYTAKPRISPRWVASQVMTQLDPGQRVQIKHHDIWIGAHMAVRQIARAILANKFWSPPEPGEGDPDLFPGLQWRYPRAHSKEEDAEYVLRDLMTEEDIDWNCARLEAEGTAKLKHAAALREWSEKRRGA